MSLAILVVLVFGINFVMWGAIGCIRRAHDWRRARSQSVARHRVRRRTSASIRRAELAVLIPAHNEELVIKHSIDSAAALLPKSQVFVVSDASTDGTVEVARNSGVRVLPLAENRGKAGALTAGLEHFGLLDRFRAVLFLDADSELDRGYVAAALAQFDDPQIVAVAGYVKVMWEPHGLTWMGRLILTHRARVYALTQMLQKFGQTWRYTNVCYIIPGFASIYRSTVLREIHMDPPGLVIEDFNMTFEVQRKRLGRIALTPRAVAYSQDPHNYGDYVRQVRRWTLGFWQTVRHQGVWVSVFWVALGLFILEVITSSLMLVALPVIALTLALPGLTDQAVLAWPWFAALNDFITGIVSGWTILFGVVLPDYLITCVVAISQRRPQYLLLGLGSLFMRVTDAAIGLAMIPRAWTERSTGVWSSPTRR